MADEDDFQPRIEDAPETPGKGTKWESLRRFVVEAAGQWCLVAESGKTTKKSRNASRAKMWSAFFRRQGYQHTGFEMRTHYRDSVYRIYVRFVAANVVRNPQ